MVLWKAARYGKWYGTQALSTTMYILRILVVVKPYHCRTMLPDCTNTMYRSTELYTMLVTTTRTH